MDSIVHVNENRTKITTSVNYISAWVDISPWLCLFKHKARMRNRVIMSVMHVFNLQVQTTSAGNYPVRFYWKISHFLFRTPFLDTLSSFCPCLSAIPFITVNVCRGKWKITPGCVCVRGDVTPLPLCFRIRRYLWCRGATTFPCPSVALAHHL